MKINNTFAIGCIVQWYEIEIIEEYLESVKNAIDIVENKENVIVDLYFNCSQELEKVDEEQISISEIKHKYEDILERLFGGLEYSKYNIRFNGINADRIRSGILTQKMIIKRSKARNLSLKNYMKGNLLNKEVTAFDVAKAFVFQSKLKKTTGNIITVDGGNIEASLR